jgi:alkanesulfonate monooxygenase SsuD/methylene tetrahydromethanopterin reductase-like flavin-dependent oxidoreductase (luciferase family)
VLSDGRVRLGVGVGWNEKEFESLGMHKKERGRRTNESLEMLERLWSGEKTDYEGRFYSFEEAEIGLRPLTPGGPPVLVGGYSDAAFERVLRFGTGWIGVKDSPEKITEVRERLVQRSEKSGRDLAGLEIGTTLNVKQQDAKEIADELIRLSEAGATFCALSLPATEPEMLAWTAEEVVPQTGLRLSPTDEGSG